MAGPARPCHFVTHLSRSHGWGTWRLNDDLKLGESTFLNTLSRLAKVLAPEEIAKYSNWKTPFCHALSCTCHAPVMTTSMLILVTTNSMLILVMAKESFGLLSALRASYLLYIHIYIYIIIYIRTSGQQWPLNSIGFALHSEHICMYIYIYAHLPKYCH